MAALGELVLRGNLTRYDMAMRSWSESDRKVARAVRRVMQNRVAYVSDQYRAAGFSEAESRARGHLLAIYVVGEETVLIGESLESRLRHFRRQVRALMKPE